MIGIRYGRTDIACIIREMRDQTEISYAYASDNNQLC
jgi:hypothetical protein